MILIQQYQYQSPAGDSVPSNECTKDQSAPWIGAMFVDAGGLGPGSYGTLLFRKPENRSNDSALQLALDRHHAQEAGIEATPVACLRLFGENNLLAVFKSFPA